MNLSKIPKRKKVLYGLTGLLVILVIILVVWLLVRLKAEIPPTIITNQATGTWQDAAGNNYSTNSNQLNIEIVGTTDQTTVVFSLESVGTRDHSSTVTLKVYNPGNLTPIATQTVSCANTGNQTASGTIVLSLASGTYDFGIKEASHLSKKLNSVSYNSSAPPTIDFGTLFGADIRDDDIINSADYSPLLSNWNGSNAPYDINRDTVVNTSDYSIMIRNWGKQGDLFVP